MGVKGSFGIADRSSSPDPVVIPGGQRGGKRLRSGHTGEKGLWGLSEAEAAAPTPKTTANPRDPDLIII